MAVSIPHSFHESGRWFGIAYMAVQLLVLAMQGTEAWRDAATRQAAIDFGTFASIAPLFVVAGGFAHDGARVTLWIIAALANVVTRYAVPPVSG